MQFKLPSPPVHLTLPASEKSSVLQDSKDGEPSHTLINPQLELSVPDRELTQEWENAYQKYRIVYIKEIHGRIGTCGLRSPEKLENLLQSLDPSTLPPLIAQQMKIQGYLPENPQNHQQLALSAAAVTAGINTLVNTARGLNRFPWDEQTQQELYKSIQLIAILRDKALLTKAR